MSNLKIILFATISLVLLAILIMIAAKLIRIKNKNKYKNKVFTEPNIFEKITLQFSDKISKELEAAEKKIRSVVGSEEKDNSEREHGMFL